VPIQILLRKSTLKNYAFRYMERVFFPTSFEANIKFVNQEIFLVLVKPLAFPMKKNFCTIYLLENAILK
jgi:hypothetical protein